MAYSRKIQPNSYVLKKERVPPRITVPVATTPPTPPTPPAPTPYYWIAGTIQDGIAVPMATVPVEITGYGTAFTAGNGSYTGVVAGGASGSITPHWFGGSFVPGQRTFSSIAADLLSQDFTFYGTVEEPPIIPSTPSYWISGTVTDVQNGPMLGVPVEISGYGTAFTMANGSYAGVTIGNSGAIEPHWFGGTFSPGHILWSFLSGDLPNQNFLFYGTQPPIPSDECPLPFAPQTVPIPTVPVQLTRNALDPDKRQLWVIDDQSETVYYMDIMAGTFAGSVTVPSPSQPGVAQILYDDVNHKMVCTTYEGSLAFIDTTTKAVTFANLSTFDNFDFHTMAVHNGTIHALPARTNNGRLWQVDGATELVTNSWSLLGSNVLSDSIAWADNIGRLVLMHSQPFSNWFWVFDPATGVFTPSGQQTSASFNYENYYVKATGHMLMSRQGFTNVEVVDISLGASGSTIATLDLQGGPTRITDATEDTCSGRLFVGDGDYIYEFSLDGNYTPIFFHDSDGDFGSLNQVGLNHSRHTNLVYYEDYNTNEVKTIQATLTGGTLATMAWQETASSDSPWAGGVSYYAGQVGWFDGTSTGDATHIQKTFATDQIATLINLGAPIPVEMRTVYYGSMADSGTIQLHSSISLFQSFTGGSSDSFSANTDGIFTGTMVSTGTINGWTQFEVSAQAAGGGNLSASPYSAYNVLNGTTTITVL